MQATQIADEPVEVDPTASYSEQMAAERKLLNGRPYCRAVQELLPDLTDWQIRNAVNGRTENALVLSAVRIVRHKMDQSQQSAEARLKEAARVLGVAA